MINRIWKMKLLFLFHLEHLPPSSLAAEVLGLQKNLHLPGLYEDCQEMLIQLELKDLKSYSKMQFKRILNRRLEEKNRLDLLQQIKHYKKLNHEQLSAEEYRLKPYITDLTLEQARSMMRLRGQVYKHIKFNFQSDLQFSRENGLCECGKGIQSQRHLLFCDIYADLKEKYSLEEDLGLVSYFDEILRRKETT